MSNDTRQVRINKRYQYSKYESCILTSLKDLRKCKDFRLSFGKTDRQKDREADNGKLYAPDLSIRGHKTRS